MLSQWTPSNRLALSRSGYDPMKENTPIATSAARTGVITATSRVIGLLRVLVISAVLGTTYLGNTFQSSNSVSNILFELLAAGGLSAVLVPALVRTAHDDQYTERLASGVLGVATIALGILALVGVLCAPLIARALTTGAPPEIAAQQLELATFLVRWFVPQIVLYGFAAIATAVLHSRRRYLVAAAAPIASTAVMIACFALFRIQAGSHPSFNIDTTSRLLLATAGTGGVLAFVATLLIPVWRAGIRLRPRTGFRDREVRALLQHSGWGILLNSISGLLAAALVIAGNVVAGGVVAIQVAFALFLAPYAILSQPLAAVALPELTDHTTSHDTSRFASTLHWTIETMCALMAPATAALMIFAQPGLTGLGLGLDQRGAKLVAAALVGLALGLVPYSGFLIMARAHYAFNDSKTPALVALLSGSVGVLVIIVTRFTLHERALVGALGFAHSLAFAIGAVVLGITMHRRSQSHVLTRRAFNALTCATGSAVPVWIATTQITVHGRLQMVAYSLVGASIYFGLYATLLRLTGFGSIRQPVDLSSSMPQPRS